MSTPSAHFIKDLRTPDQIDVREMILPLVVIDVHEAVARNPDSPGQAARGPDRGREQGRAAGVFTRPLAALETGPARPEPAPARHHELFQKTFF